MFKKAVKGAIRRPIQRTRSYIQSLEHEANEKPDQKHKYDEDDFVYPWFNSIFEKLLSEGGAKLRPHYTWGVLHGGHLARAIGINRVSVIEFGVAGGNGLLSLERIAEKVEGVFGIGIDVYGFDNGIGLPKPGERLAISEFNASHSRRKISPIYGLKYFLPVPHAQAEWSEQMYMAHIFDHDLYRQNDGLVRRPIGGSTHLIDE